jgi:hypothetical protein
MKPAVAAFRMHSGWGALVVISGSSGSPELIERRRITIIDPAAIGAKQPYHFAESLCLPEAENHLRRCADASEDLALKAIRQTQLILHENGYDVVATAMLLASPRALPPLANILRAHPLIHSAEGEFFRKAVQQACQRSGLACTGFRESELDQQAKSEFGRNTQRHLRKIEALGRLAGPPWTQDYKRAALAAWILLTRTLNPHAHARWNT